MYLISNLEAVASLLITIADSVFKEFTNNCYTENFTEARVITGKGKMVKEFTTWALNHPKVRNVFLESTGGSFLIKISKKS